MDETIKKAIAETAEITANVTILKLKAAGLLKDQSKTAFEKTETLLYQYKELCKSEQPYAQAVVKEINDCLESIAAEPYAETIKLFYFENLSNEGVANKLFCDERTARRHRRRFVEKMAARLASDDFIRELLL